MIFQTDSSSARAGPLPGPNTLNDLFAWPLKAGAMPRQMPKFAHVMQRHMSAGVLVFSDHSGTGNGEHGILDVLRSIDGDWTARAVVYSVCDYSNHAQKALRWTSQMCIYIYIYTTYIPVLGQESLYVSTWTRNPKPLTKTVQVLKVFKFVPLIFVTPGFGSQIIFLRAAFLCFRDPNRRIQTPKGTKDNSPNPKPK